MQDRTNKILILRVVLLIYLFIFFVPTSAQKIKKLTPEVVIDAMKRSSDYMVNTVSCHGGYLWYYSEDMTERFGEVPARPSQIWVQGAGTPAMGELFLEMYQTTGDRRYLRPIPDALDWIESVIIGIAEDGHLYKLPGQTRYQRSVRND